MGQSPFPPDDFDGGQPMIIIVEEDLGNSPAPNCWLFFFRLVTP